MTDIELKEIKVEEPEEKIWHHQQELILKKWSEIGSSYRYMHDKAYADYKKQSFRFALPVIILSTITGTANFAQASFPTAWHLYVPLGIGFLNLTAGLITTVAQFLRVNELLEGHRSAAISYSKFSRNISVELSLPREDRTTGGTEFINRCRTELDRLIEQSPTIPEEIIKEFGTKFNENDFMKPEILNITAVKIYRDNEKEKAKQKLRDLKNMEAIKNELLKEENKRRQSIIKELLEQQKIQEEKLKKDLIEKKKHKKNSLSVSNVSDNLKNLLEKLKKTDLQNDIITPASSLQSSEDITPDYFNVKKNNNLNEIKEISNPNNIPKSQDIILEINETQSVKETKQDETVKETKQDETKNETKTNETEKKTKETKDNK